MFGWFRTNKTPDVTARSPAEVQELAAQRAVTLVDVREPAEFAQERIAGAVNVPLSRLGAGELRLPSGERLVLYCRSGARSLKAASLCAAAGLAVDSHMAGGIMAWKAAGLPVDRGA